MRWFHNDKVSLGWAIIIELVVHALFAFQAFLLGDFLGEIALVVVLGPIGGPIGAWALALFIFGAAFQAFVLGEYMREHVESFEATAKGNGSYIANWHMIKWLVGGIEISSLIFRCYTIVIQPGNMGHNITQAIIVAILGIIALWYAFAQAKVIHASINRPVEYDVNRARNQAGRAIVSDALDRIPQMSAEQKRRFYTGDLSAIEEVYQSDLQRRQEKLQVKEERDDHKRQRELEKQQRIEEKRERERERREGQKRDHQTGQDYTQKLLGGEPSAPFLKAVPNQAQQDGNQNQRNRA
jgi:signal transduction histidine kinase